MTNGDGLVFAVAALGERIGELEQALQERDTEIVVLRAALDRDAKPAPEPPNAG